MSGLLIRSQRVVRPRGVEPAAIHIRDGRIVEVAEHHARVPGTRELNAGSLVVLPGLVDSHVHINDPGRAHWEGFESATRAAAAGGITTLVDMPLNSIPPTTTVSGLEAKRAAAAGRCHVDVGFWGGVVPGNCDELSPLAGAGVMGFKCFLCPSGVEEFAPIGADELGAVLPLIAARGLPLLVHAELPGLVRDPLAPVGGRAPDPRQYATWLMSRPSESERAAIDLVLRLARQSGAHVHIVHLAAADALPLIAAARRDRVRVTVETCPHYLTFAAEQIPDAATPFKCAPPIRDAHHRAGLWAGLIAGEIDLIASDHSPAPAADKLLEDGDFVRAWGGVASLQIALSVVWTGLASRGLGLEHLARWMAEAPARLAGLGHRKGMIAPGYDADLVIWDPDATTTVDARALYHRHAVTPYEGARLRGRVRTTLLGGEVVFDGAACEGPPRGRLLSR